ncbi:glycerophosphodiester phosphodiesterase [Amycolatopsis aidingensis]|uniref:glycerophosphodiester phosphodiesterase n=1 Tax=Amycolatopsis aidingensis TaxID=2842453 RepID=UPI001C0C9C0A|nr:glycerophosphodiester phosphodiesterase family protein [Amycolatopsis aidingensis]
MLIIGHRGAAGHAPENTLASFRAAVDLGVDYVEADIQATRDGQLVVFHDKLLDRVTGATGYVWDHDYADLTTTTVGGEPIPLLGELCEVLRGTSVRLMAEILSPAVTELTLKVLDESLDTDQYLLASFQHDALRDAKALRPDVPTLALWEGAPVDPVRLLTDCGAGYAGLGFESIRAEQVRAIQDAGLQVFTWTVNDPREIDRARALGVDGIVSDFPDRVRD